MKLGIWLVMGLIAVVGAVITAGYLRMAPEGADDAYAGLDASPALQVIRRTGRGHGVTAAEGRHMHDLILRRGYSRGLDIVTAHGYSALWFGMALSRNGGSVVTVEIDPSTQVVRFILTV
jgi:predicted O-methyltransferase YrrM